MNNCAVSIDHLLGYGNVPWTITAGDDEFMFVDFVDSLGVPIDLTGRIFRAEVRKVTSTFTGPPLVTLTPAAGIGVDLGLSRVALTLTRAQTASLRRISSLRYDLRQLDSLDRYTTLFGGPLVVGLDVTEGAVP